MMAVQKVDIKERKRSGQPQSTADSGITWSGSSRPSVVEYRDGIVRKSVITVPAFSFTTTAAAKGIGQGIYTFPEGWVLPIAASVTYSYTPGDNSTAGEIGLGTTIASGAVSVLSGTAAFQDIMDGKTLGNGTGGTAVTGTFKHAGGGTSGTMDALDGSSAAKEVHLNIASTWGGTGGVVVNSATVTLWWIDLGDS